MTIVSGFSPSVASPGDTVFIVGQGFTGTTVVSINGIPATFVRISDMLIAAIVPSGIINGGMITVTSPGGTGISPGAIFIKLPASGPVMTHYAATPISPTLFDGLQAYWTLNGPTWPDSVDGFNLSATGSPTTTSGFGNVGNVTVFNGTDYLGVNSTVIASAPFTVAGWVNFASMASFDTLFSVYGSGGRYFTIQTDSSPNQMQVKTQSATVVFGQVLTTGVWYHLAYTYDGAIIQEYRNGIGDPFGPFGVVFNGTSGGFTFLGSDAGSNDANVSMVGWGVWNRVLSLQGIQNLYEAGNGLPYSATLFQNLVG